MNPTNMESNEEIMRRLLRDPKTRAHAARRSHFLFFNIYFPHYARYPMAKFQREMLQLVQNPEPSLLCFVAFRGSGKSTLITLSYSLWAILGIQQKKFLLIICQTQAQARQQMANLREELEHNDALKSDMGPFREEPGGEWSSGSLVFRNTGARIMIASVEQSTRGIRHKQYRPDLIILDDIEDYASTRTRDGREKVFEWFTREIVPLGDLSTRIVIVANFLHEDSLISRLRKLLDAKELDGLYRWFPLLDKGGRALWPEKFDLPGKIEALRRSVMDEVAWRHEYLLEEVSDHTRAIHPEWIRYYDELPPPDERSYHLVAIDLAISEEKRADYTAMVVARVFGHGENLRVYILPNPTHIKADFPKVMQTIKNLSNSIPGHKKILVEGVGFQEGYVQQARHEGYDDVIVMRPLAGTDKRARLVLMSPLIQDGRMQFASKGNEEIIAELTDLGNGGHDDLADTVGMIGRYLLQPKPEDDYRGIFEYTREWALRAKLPPEPRKPEPVSLRISDILGLTHRQNRWPLP